MAVRNRQNDATDTMLAITPLSGAAFFVSKPAQY